MSTENRVTADELDGERGMPSVNAEKRGSPKKAFAFIVVVLVLFITAALLYRTFIKHQREAAEAAASTNKELAAPGAPKSFGLPPPPMPEQPVPGTAPVAVVPAPAPAGPERPQQLGSSGGTANSGTMKPPATLDKSGSALMMVGAGTQTGSGGAAAPATPVAMPSLLGGGGGASGALGELLKPTAAEPRSASVLPDRSYLLTKGTMIDCALQTKLDTTVPGMTSCVVTQPIYSDNGKVLLIDRGSVVTGEYQSNMRQGMARIFVLWDRVKTPNGVVVSFDSPGTDALGAGGVPGYVNNHFWKRFGGAIMLSLIQDTTAALVANQQSGQTIQFGNTSSATDEMAAEALKATINIPPTLIKNQGERVGIYIARDLDFRSVYELHSN